MNIKNKDAFKKVPSAKSILFKQNPENIAKSAFDLKEHRRMSKKSNEVAEHSDEQV